MKKIRFTKEFGIITIAVIILASLFAFLDGSDHWFQSWFAYLIMLGLGAGSIYWVWRVVKVTPKVTTVAITSFSLRLSAGIALAVLLPILGYQNNTEHLSGYVYTDAFIRDGQAWGLATSGNPLSHAFSGQFSGDQYGGMLAMSAFIYRFLSPDAHRPFLILILAATLSAWGVLCLWKASRTWFDEKTALLTIWLFALYPESVLLGSSQMREAFVIPLTAISFYGLTEILGKRWTGWLWLISICHINIFHSTFGRVYLIYSSIGNLAPRPIYIKQNQATSNHIGCISINRCPHGDFAFGGLNPRKSSLNSR